MTREEILINSIWVDAKLIVYSSFFEREVRINLYPSELNLEHTKKIVSNKMVQTVNDFLELSTEYKPLMKSLLYSHCRKCCEGISYGCEIQEGETEAEANLREFGITDETSAFEKAKLHHITIREEDYRRNRFVSIVFYPEWEAEHGCELLLKNGILLDFHGEHGTYLGQFDD